MKKIRPLLFNEGYGVLVLLIAINLVIGLFWANDYGISIDEPEVYETAFYRIKAYRTGTVPEDFYNLNKYSHGGAYYVVAKVVAEGFERLFPKWTMFDHWHMTHFLFFQLGGLFIFLLSRKFANVLSSLGTVVLFFFQPVLWGHAFINPKDTPFMTLMLGAIVFGIYTGDNLGRRNSKKPGSESFKGDGPSISSLPYRIWDYLKTLFSIRWYFLTVIFVAICCATRVHGIVTLGVIGVYWLYQARQQAIEPLIWLVVLSIGLGLALWPDLWSAPLQNYASFWSNVFAFEGWNAKIFFDGVLYNKTNYPRTFLPTLISLKLTAPLLILFVIGFIRSSLSIWRKNKNWILLLLLAIWFFGPILLAVIIHPTIYNNIRQFLFIFPPVFIFAAIALDFFLGKISNTFMKVVIVLAIALPGMISIFSLHPYEYTFFNIFTGYLPGAYREYELDYWLTSYREAAEILNETAPLNSVVGTHIGGELLEYYLRDDLTLLRLRGETIKNSKYYIMTTNQNLDQEIEGLFPSLRKIDQIERLNVPLTIIYEVTGD